MIDLKFKSYPGEDDISFIKRNAYYLRILKPRIDHGNRTIDEKLVSSQPLSAAEKKEIDDFWNRYFSPRVRDELIDYRFYGVFKNALLKDEHLYNYIPDSFFYVFVDEYFTNPQHSVPCDDKTLFDLFLHDINRPKTVFRKVRDVLIDENDRAITFNQAVDRIREAGQVHLRISKFSNGDFLIWNPDNDSLDSLESFLQHYDYVICRQVVKQHPTMAELNPTSVNTIRMMTLIFKGQVFVLSSVVRFGKKGQKTDSVSDGGQGCGVKDDGQLRDLAYDVAAHQFSCHPDGKPFKEFRIPNFNKCIDLVSALARRFMSISRLISWDVCIDENGNPLLNDYYLSRGGINLHQICNGPIFGDLTHDVLTEVCTNSYTLNSIIKSI